MTLKWSILLKNNLCSWETFIKNYQNENSFGIALQVGLINKLVILEGGWESSIALIGVNYIKAWPSILAKSYSVKRAQAS